MPQFFQILDKQQPDHFVLKNRLRELLPAYLQVPVKYAVNAMHGRLEEELKLLRWLVKPGDTAIDIGGNRGVYAYSLWRLGARIEVFEPNPACAKVLSAWSMNKSTLQVHEVALSNQEGVADLHIPVDGSGVEHDASASLEHDDFCLARNEQVMLRTLDSFDFEGIVFVKIDVEGHEFNVLLGAEHTLRAQRPAVLVEIEQRHCRRPIGEIFTLLAEWGYQGFYLERGCLTPLGSFDAERDQSMKNFSGRRGRYINNFLFLHQDRLHTGDYAALFEAWGGK